MENAVEKIDMKKLFKEYDNRAFLNESNFIASKTVQYFLRGANIYSGQYFKLLATAHVHRNKTVCLEWVTWVNGEWRVKK